MTLMNESEINYPRTVTISRPAAEFDETGNPQGDAEVIVSSLIADIQQSLKIRDLASEDRTGISDNTVWLMFCLPPAELREGDLVADGARAYVIDSVADWGSHVECTMRKT